MSRLARLSRPLLFSVGKYLIGLYLGRAGVSSGFGAAGSLVIILVWVYYSAQNIPAAELSSPGYLLTLDGSRAGYTAASRARTAYCRLSFRTGRSLAFFESERP